MPVQPSISPDQIVTIVAFLLLLFTLLWLVKRNRGGIAGRLRPTRRMTHIEDLALAPHQRLHLIEVDGRTFMVHAGKGHAASFIAVDGEVAVEPQAAATAPSLKAGRTKSGSAKSAKSKKQSGVGQSGVGQSGVGQSGVGQSSDPAAKAARPTNAFAAAIAQARRNNPSVEFGK